jgi:hypothetical protein
MPSNYPFLVALNGTLEESAALAGDLPANLRSALQWEETSEPTVGVAHYMAIDSNAAPVKVPSLYLTPEMFLVGGNRIGDGANDDAILTAWANACNTLGLEAHGSPGAVYTCSSSLQLTLRVRFKGNGAIFSVPNDGQTSHPLIFIESVATDIDTTITLAAVNAWTGLKKGSRQIPELTEKDWAYSFYSADQFILKRSTSGSLNYGEAFSTTTDDGWLDAPLVRTYSQPFTDLTIVRRKIREPLTIEGLTVRVMPGTSNGLNRLVTTSRPNTLMLDCHIYNLSSGNIQQGFVAESTVDIIYDQCSVSGLGIVSTEYAFNSNYSDRLTYIDCWQTDCRRGTDGHAAKNINVIRCDLPDGTGAHWVDGLTVENSILGFRSALNPRCVQVSGSDILLKDNTYHIGTTGNAFCMRSDFPEISGYCILRGGIIHIYDEGDTPIPAGDILVMQLQAYDSYDCLRTVYQPSYLEFTPDLVKQYGAASTNDINLVNVGCPKSAANFPQSVDTSGRMLIAPGKLDFDAGKLNGSLPRAYVAFYKGETQIGTTNDALVKNMPCVYVFSSPFSASVSGTAGRYNITVEDASDASSGFDLRYGSTKNGPLRRCNPAATFNRAGAVSALGDEAIDFEDYGANTLGLCTNPFGSIIQRGNGITVADGGYGPDGWVGLNESGNLTFSVASNIADGLPFVMRWLQPDVSAKRLGAICHIGSGESIAFRSRLVTLVAKVRALSGGTVRYAIGEWTGTANTPTWDVVNNWASGTFTAGNFFINTTTNILATGSVSLTAATVTTLPPIHAHVGSSCNNLWIMFWMDAAVAQNSYLEIAADLYPGFDRPLQRRRTIQEERMRCWEWYKSLPMNLVSTFNVYVPLIPQMTKTPTVTATVGTPSNASVNGFNIGHTGSTATTVTIDGSL